MNNNQVPHKKTAHLHPLHNKIAFQNALIKWFEKFGKSYPWRDTTDPWNILVSEVMLQQTTIASVIANRRYEKFIRTYPDLYTISQAKEDDLLLAWEGLGYYNRVRNLQKTAQSILDDHEGSFPRDLDQLKKLPGIGPYTAGAISSFAFDKPAPLVDGNVYRLFSRLFDDPSPIDIPKDQKTFWSYAEFLLPRKNARLYNSALMEVGQLFCLKKNPLCTSCPVQQFCQCRLPENLPVKAKKTAIIDRREQALLKINTKGEILLQRQEGRRRKGFWQLPRIHRDSSTKDTHFTFLKKSIYHITKYRVQVDIFESSDDLEIAGQTRAFSIHELATTPISTPERKMIGELTSL